jgi:chromosome partitioning protein
VDQQPPPPVAPATDPPAPAHPRPGTARSAATNRRRPTTPRRYAVTSGKGGCSKTASSISLAAVAVERGLRPLVVDTDPELHATWWLASDRDGDPALWEVFEGGRDRLDDAIVATEHGIDLIRGCSRLARVDTLLAQDPVGVPRALQRALDATDLTAYDLVFIDCPPNTGLLPVAAIAAAGMAIVPVQPSNLDQRGLLRTRDIVDAVARNLRADAHIAAVIPTRTKTGTTIASRSVQRLRDALGDELVTPTVRDAVDLADAPGHHQPITILAPKSAVADDYRAVFDHLLPQER